MSRAFYSFVVECIARYNSWHNIILCKFVRALHKPYASEWSQYKLTVMSPLDSLCIKCFTKTRFEIYIYVNYGNYTRETQECRLNTIHSSYVVTCKVTLIPRIISIFLAPEFEFKCGLRKSLRASGRAINALLESSLLILFTNVAWNWKIVTSHRLIFLFKSKIFQQKIQISKIDFQISVLLLS